MDSTMSRRHDGLRLAPSLALCLALGMGAASAQPQLSIESAVAQATGRSQLVTAADSQARAAREMATAAGQLPDPVLASRTTPPFCDTLAPVSWTNQVTAVGAATFAPLQVPGCSRSISG